MKSSFCKRLLKAITAFLLAAALVMPMPARAAEQTDREAAEAAGSRLGEIIELILREYAGDPVGALELYEAALRGMSNILDRYSNFLPETESEELFGALSGKYTGIGIVVRSNDLGQPEILRVIAGSPAMEAGIKRGDVITHINGTPTKNYSPEEISTLILEGETPQIKMQIRRGTIIYSYSMTKREIPSVSVYSDRFEDLLGPAYAKYSKSYGYIAINSVSVNTADDLWEHVAAFKRSGVEGIVLDLRGNTGGYLDVCMDICEIIVPAGPIFYLTDNRGKRELVSSSLIIPPFEKMVVLTDGRTASAAELIAAALQDAGIATVVGEKTYGKGVIQTLFPLTTGGLFLLTTNEYLRRSGEKMNGVGVTPDIPIEGMAAKDYETQKDKALLKAIEVLTGNGE